MVNIVFCYDHLSEFQFLLSVVLPIVGILLLIVAAICFLYNRYVSTYTVFATATIVHILSLFRYGPRPSGGPDIGPSPIYSKFEYQQDDWEVHRDNVSWGQNSH